MPDKELKIRDLVKLNSGGPLMTVKCINDNAIIDCKWPVDGKVQYGSFPLVCLTKIV